MPFRCGTPSWSTAIDLVREGKLGQAERLTKDFLMQHPADVSAMRILADIALKLDQLKDAQQLLERCLQLAPDFHLARHNYAVVLLRQRKTRGSLCAGEKLLALEPNNPGF